MCYKIALINTPITYSFLFCYSLSNIFEIPSQVGVVACLESLTSSPVNKNTVTGVSTAKVHFSYTQLPYLQ